MKSWIVAALLARSAVAGPIFLAEWYEFGFDPNHFPSVAGCQPADPSGVPCRAGTTPLLLDTPPWTFSSAGVLNLQITDAFLPGDRFSVYDFGVLIGSTPPVPVQLAMCGLDPNQCFTDPAFSHATFQLPPGSHSLTVTVQPAQLLGEGFFRVLAVPEPALSMLGGLTLLVFGGLARRRSRRTGADRRHGNGIA